MDDAGEGRILPQQADAGVTQHYRQEARLALGEAELGDGADTFFDGHKLLLTAVRIDGRSGGGLMSLTVPWRDTVKLAYDPLLAIPLPYVGVAVML